MAIYYGKIHYNESKQSHDPGEHVPRIHVTLANRDGVLQSKIGQNAEVFTRRCSREFVMSRT